MKKKKNKKKNHTMATSDWDGLIWQIRETDLNTSIYIHILRCWYFSRFTLAALSWNKINRQTNRMNGEKSDERNEITNRRQFCFDSPTFELLLLLLKLPKMRRDVATPRQYARASIHTHTHKYKRWQRKYLCSRCGEKKQKKKQGEQAKKTLLKKKKKPKSF